MKKDKRETEKCTAANERFGASGAVIRPKGSVDFQVLCLVSSVVEAPPSPSREALDVMLVKRCSDSEEEKENYIINCITDK